MDSPIPWMGSKRRLAPQILKLMPEHTCYVEAFAGGASVLFARPEPAKSEVLNDLNGDLVNFFRVAKHHVVEFCNQFRFAIVSRQMFEWEREADPEALTDIQLAARFYYLQRLGFGAKVTSRTFGTSTTSRPKVNFMRLEEDMSELHARLATVYIEHLDWEMCVAKYDRPHTLFLLDPPYWELSGYGTSFGLEQYERLASVMARAQGKIILTINDHPEMRRIFKGFKRDLVKIRYMVGAGRGRTSLSTESIYRSW